MELLMLQINNVSYTYPSSAKSIFTDISLTFGKGWTGLVGANGSGKTTLLAIAAGEILPDSGHVKSAGLLVFCRQRSDNPGPNELKLFDPFSWNNDKEKLCRQLKINAEMLDRWQVLSNGEQKRIQIASAMALKPDILLVDEPTNHLDKYSTDLIVNTFKDFDGIGVLISHDRRLLDDLCSKIVFLDPPDCLEFSGNYSGALTQKQTAENSMISQRDNLKKNAAKIENEMKRLQAEAERSKSRVSKKHVGRHDADMRAKINLAKLTGKDATAGNLAASFSKRVERIHDQLDQTKVKKRYNLDFQLKGEPAKKDCIVRLPAQNLAMGPDKSLEIPDLIILPDDKIGITGVNGSGKSTFIKFLITEINFPEDKILYIPQELSAERSSQIVEEIKKLPSALLGQVMSFISCLGSIASRVLETSVPSPGEIRKLFLALGLLNKPWVIIMDEPTNHLDLPAIELLESALAQVQSCLILVSHDETFLSALINKRLHCKNLTESISVIQTNYI